MSSFLKHEQRVYTMSATLACERRSLSTYVSTVDYYAIVNACVDEHMVCIYRHLFVPTFGELEHSELILLSELRSYIDLCDPH